ESNGENREVLIYMNHPLRYNGDTFFQADFLKNGQTGTVLQVVRNPGWTMPYISCVMVALGMMIHFGITLVNFLQKQSDQGYGFLIIPLGFSVLALFWRGSHATGTAKQPGPKLLNGRQNG